MATTPTPTEFWSQGERCAADLYLPEGDRKPPVILMAHGFAAERTFGLRPFAERFTQAGWAVITFDYRGFGESAGQPRLLVSPPKHREDLQAALAYIRSRDDLDTDNIVLWGSSYGGGHCLVAAAQDPEIRAVVVQVPHVDAWQTMRNLGLRYLLQATWHGLRDLLTPSGYHVKVVAPPQAFAVMNTPESDPGYTALVPDPAQWRNQCRGTSLLLFASYRPIQFAKKINCPVLVIGATQDSLIDIRSLRKLARQNPQISLSELPVGHFDVYRGAWFEKVIAKEIDFIQKQWDGLETT